MSLAPKEDTNFYNNYRKYKEEFLEFLRHKVISPNEIEEAKVKSPRDFYWDIICIDEAQDWPEDEKEILYKLYGHKNFIIADGDDQLIRNQIRNDWKLTIPKEDFTLKNLYDGLRLKAKLCDFANNLAEKIEYDWQVKRLLSSEGGKIILWIGHPPVANFSNLDKILNAAEKQNNKPADILICMPPKRAQLEEFEWVENLFQYWSKEINPKLKFWDGTKEEIRRERAYNADEIRLVQYESCRGLEGWATIFLYLDDFFDFCRKNPYFTENDIQRDIWISDEELAYRYACQWLMIPLSRAIDTLVIHIYSADSDLGKILTGPMRKYFDEIIEA